jgi:hyperosmotically inducible protein
MAGIAPATAQQHVQPIDRRLASQIERRLLDQNVQGVNVTVLDGIAALSGTVSSRWAKDQAIQSAWTVKDVKDVVNALTIRRGESDQAVGEAVAARLERYVFFTVFDDVNVVVADGVVTLTGHVTMLYKAMAMAQLAARIEGVQDVVDAIELLPVSGSDDQIRYTTALRIYGDPLFWNYAIQVDPPIHIVVEDGHVTLTGVVATDVERRKAERIARDVLGVQHVKNELRLKG